MSRPLRALQELVAQDPTLQAASAAINASGDPTRRSTIVAPVGIRALLLARARTQTPCRPLVVVTATGRDAANLRSALSCYCGQVEVLPAWETLPHERLSPQRDTMARRIAVMRRLAHPERNGPGKAIDVLVVPLRAFLQPVVAGLGEIEPIRLLRGSVVDLTTLVDRFVALGYERVDKVTRRGELAVRGGLIDVFAPTDPHPLRIELFGDEVDDIRFFSVSDQRTIGPASDGVWAPAAREILLTEAVRAAAAAAVTKLPGAQDMLDQIADGVAVEGMEALSPVLVDKLVPLTDVLPADVTIVVADPERIQARAEDLVATTEEFLSAAWSAAAGGGAIPVQASKASFLTWERMRQLCAERDFNWVELTAMLPPVAAQALAEVDEDALAPLVLSESLIILGARDVRAYRGKIDAAVADLASLVADQWRIVVTTEGAGSAKRIGAVLAGAAVPARVVTQLDGLEPGVVNLVAASAGPGFISSARKLAVVTESDLTGRSGPTTRDMRAMPSRHRRGIDPLTLTKGDLVVHEHHGIGRFVDMVSRTMGAGENAVTRDYLLIEYAPSRRGGPPDRLYVPTDQLDQVSQYAGSDSPKLSKMGGAEWASTKAKARKAVREIAAELVRLYSARQATKGFAFSPDTPWQRELEDAFDYVETPDQLVTIEEVKADMEKPVPMDRLLCGDVGYGKTEIAVRAAFKAVQDGKQVAVLVPTTLLVQQHLETFTQRYAGFPVEVAALSRFSSAAEAEDVRERLLSGGVDVVIGTHALVTGQVRFKNLGLVIIDEEQRFGVEHKEALKQLRTDVDVLSMSATPIPRTLEMAVTGLREMSVLQTPPEQRHPILTFVGAYSDRQVVAAIKRELLRDGQVFYVHNRTSDISKVAKKISDLVPQARVRIAHGKLSESQLERVIVDFWNREFDVLVCTTIVETGLDIANANTLIVDRADAMGLSQLHQLRGRVGRGRERAYAYFLYPGDKALTQTAHERLATIAANTDLGSGMAVAQKDLEIRGAGNLLGGQQSGHIDGVGFDLYVRMVADAVSAFRDGVVAPRREMRVELPVDAHIPVSYVDGEQLRLETYARIAAVVDEGGADAVREELRDRFGPLPDPVERLFKVALLRQSARDLQVGELAAQGRFIRFAPVDLSDAAAMRLRRLYPGSVMKPAIRTILVPAPVAKDNGGVPVVDEPLLEWVQRVLDNIVAFRPGSAT